MSHLRLFVVEGPDPMDLLDQSRESEALQKICELIGHEVAVLTARSFRDLKQACRYVASIDGTQLDSSDKTPLCVHLAAHGNSGGLVFGADQVSWNKLVAALAPLCMKLTHYSGRVILVLSACHADEQKLTQAFNKSAKDDPEFVPPMYLFATRGAPSFSAAVVSWTVFYHLLPAIDLSDKKSVRDALYRVKSAGAAKLMYFRWDQMAEAYRRFTPKRRKVKKS